jgi:membrane-bound lytic murein transglycosylase D
MYRLFLVFLALGIEVSVPGYAATLATMEIPSLAASVRIEKDLDFCGEPVPTGVQDVRERYEKELLLTLWDRAQVILWLKRSRRYLPYIDETLRKEGMPEDLRYVAIAESALRAHAGSNKGAMGYWQFTRSTGRKYGLAIDSRIDERRNLFASTRAAVRYFKDLYSQFGSWTLAVTAYNMGEDGLMAEILEQGTHDYYQLYLPLETELFVFRILSVKVILSDPGKFGFNLSDQDYYPPLEFDEIQVDCPQETPIWIIAQAAGTHFKAIKDLNPEIRGHHLSPGPHKLLVPKGASSGFYQRYREILEKYLAVKRDSVYVVKQGDNLSAIAERFGVPLASLIIWNRLDLSRPIYAGQELVIHQEDSLQGEEAVGQAGKKSSASASSND